MFRGRALIALLVAAATFASAPGAFAAEPESDPAEIVVDEGVARGDRFAIEGSWVWRGPRTITYANKAKEYKAEVKRAAAAWNKSGAKVTWKPAPASSARVIIRVNPNIPSAGLAWPRQTSGLIEIVPNLVRNYPPKENGSAIATGIIAHEMGHIIGLDHEIRKCATMNANLWSNCRGPDENWEYRCRPLEPDDARGGVKIFSGKLRPLGSPFCAYGKAPNSVNDFAGSHDAQAGETLLTWSLPSKNAPKDLTIYRGKRNQGCPTAKGEDKSGELYARAGAERTKDYGASPGEYCYRAVGRNEYGRPGDSTTTRVVVTGLAPQAGFDYRQMTGTSIEFHDESFDPDGHIVAWDWDFGDGSAGSSEDFPTHTYAEAGVYEVTLTVTDNSGATASVTKSVQVIAPGTPWADFGWYQFEGTTVEFYDLSWDEDGNVVAWDWDFGDGSAGSTEQDPVHEFPAPGDYDVTLSVEDDDGKGSSVTYEVTVFDE